MPPHTFYIL
jgi:hypothetical protein